MNRFYLLLSFFLIQLIGFSQIQLSLVEDLQTNYCLSSNLIAQVQISVDTPDQSINGSEIEYMVVDSFGNNVDSGNFNDSFQKIILFYESGDYFVHASVQDLKILVQFNLQFIHLG